MASRAQACSAGSGELSLPQSQIFSGLGVPRMRWRLCFLCIPSPEKWHHLLTDMQPGNLNPSQIPSYLLPRPNQSPGPLKILYHFNSFQIYPFTLSLLSQSFSSVTQSCPTLCDPMHCSTPGLPVHHQLPEFTQTHVHWVSDAIWPSHPLLSPSPPAFNLSQHQGLFQWVSSSYQVAKVLEF